MSVHIPKDRPWVVMSTAMTLDGKIGSRARTRIKLSSDEDAKEIDKLRAKMDAILIGGVTLEHDDPRLIVRDGRNIVWRERKGLESQPVKVVITRHFSAAWGKRFLRTGGKKVIFTTSQMSESAHRLIGKRADIHVLGRTQVNIKRAMEILRKQYRIKKMMVEGGSTMNFEMLKAGCIDHLRIAIAPKLLGGECMPTLVGGTGFVHTKMPELKFLKKETRGGTMVLHYNIKR